MAPPNLNALIRSKSAELGANLVGFAPARLPPGDGDGQAYQKWLEGGMHGTMSYMARDPGERSSVERWFEPARSVVLLGFSYGGADDRLQAGAAAAHDASRGRVASYACFQDYHAELKKRVEALLAALKAADSEIEAKSFVDTSPVLERRYGRHAGMGWIGKNTMLISPKRGSYFLLSGFALNRELEYDRPMPDHCGTCNRCIDACPTDAFPRPRVLDASRCIAYLTIEHRGPIPEGLREGVGDWIFGCDVCQEVCPWNRFQIRNPIFQQQVPFSKDLVEAVGVAESGFKKALGHTPIERARAKGLLRNALLAMGNSGLKAYEAALKRFTANADPMIAEQARWSLARLADFAVKALVVALVLWPAAPRALAADAAAGAVATSSAPAVALSTATAQPAGATAAKRKRKKKPITKEQIEAQMPTPTTLPKAVERQPEEAPWYISWMFHPTKRGISIRLPIVDTDPNRGVTLGVMPIWIARDPDSSRIRAIHAPSLTYNRIFELTPTYRYYYYPTLDSTLNLRGSYSQKTNREIMGEFEDYHFLGKDLYAKGRLQMDVEGSRRFFGIGPDTPKTNETNYTMDSLKSRATIGPPIYPYSNWTILMSHFMSADRIRPGPFPAVPSTETLFPTLVPGHRHQTSALRLGLNFDGRDHPVTTSKGAYADLYMESSQKAFASEYDYNRYGVDLRYFRKTLPKSDYVTGSQLHFEQVVGNAPFWQLPQLGGKYLHRAYGVGRYTDKGVFLAQLEERVRVYQMQFAGVSTEFEAAPFAGIGQAFNDPGQLAAKYIRPVVGGSMRAVARPQVVGSIDIGVGQEGVSTFMDINYPF